METTQLIILKRDQQLLKSHLLKSQLSDYNKNKLMQELNNARVVKDGKLPADVICLDSKVEIQDVEKGQKFSFQLVMPSEANMKKNKISVFAPVGIAILGHQVGAKVQWEMPNGIRTFEILNVKQQVIEQEIE